MGRIILCVFGCALGPIFVYSVLREVYSVKESRGQPKNGALKQAIEK